ncbi:hybrid sensor histidine kinase/response regulator transcription factor [Siphonobacter sp. SORGH_AS_1065]|nr:hybrid sensor histidine kinase/response regulator transcription factor [Siphonobacter sp. SORGH_AS_1065]
MMFTSLTTKDGLSSNTIAAILKDKYGLLWFATEDGLNKYNGSNFTVYHHEQSNPNSLGSNEVSALFEDAAGRLWIGTIEGSLHLYDRKKDSFIRINVGLNVYSICSDQQGRLWVGTHSGVFNVDPQTLKVTRPPIKNYALVDGKPCRRVFEDQQKRIWITTNDGLVVYQKKTNQFKAFFHDPNNPNSLASSTTMCITQDKKGRIWVGTQNGLNLLLPDESGFKTFRYQKNDPASLSNNTIYAIEADEANRLWICTEMGLNIMDGETGKVERYLPNPNVPFSLANRAVKCMFIDRMGITWLGTYQGGINKYDKNLTLFGLQKSRPGDAASLSAPFVTSFAENPNGDLWVGTDGGGLNLYHRKTNRFSRFRLYSNEGAELPNLAILCMTLAPRNQLWIGTFQEGLFLLDVATGKCQQFKAGLPHATINHNDIFCLKTDRSGKIWIGTNGGGLNCFDPVRKEFTYLNPPSHPSPSVIPLNAYIRAIEEDQQGNLWIGSFGTGLAVLNPVTQKAIRYDKGNSNLPSNRITSIHADEKGSLWIGTNGEGLVRFNPASRSFIPYGAQKGLPNGIVNKILSDGEGRLWVSTNKGISSLDEGGSRFTNYTAHNGLQDDIFAYGSGLLASDQTLFFGGIQGFNFLTTSTIKSSALSYPIQFTDLKVGNKTITAADSTITPEHISLAKVIHLDYKQNFSISYASLNYTNAHQNAYRYRLKGYQEDWYYAGKTTVAHYTNLNPGEYVFEVQTSTHGNVWNPQGASITLVVHPPFYLTIYAYLFYAFALGFTIWYLRRRGIQKIRQKFMEEQQKREVQRIRDLDQMKIKFLTNLSHEFRTPISLILAPLEGILAKKHESAIDSQLQTIERNSKRLLNLVNQLLDFKQIEQQEQTLHLSTRNVVSFVKETCDSFQDLSEKKHIDFVFESYAADLELTLDFDKIERVLYNLLSNAFKFTPKGGKIRLKVFSQMDEQNPDQHWLCVSVKDTGIGIAQDKHSQIFERFYQEETQNSIMNPGSGIGLSIAQEFVVMHGGKLLVDSEPGKGSTFIMYLPLVEAPSSQVVFLQEERAEAAPLLTEKSGIGPSGIDTAERLLIVEDNDEFRHYLMERLKVHYHVFEAADGREGWQKTLSIHPTLIISDVAMPNVDGIEFSQKVKSDKRTSHIPLILLTASTGDQQQLRGLLSGANDYLTKPFNFEILNAKVNNLLALNRVSKGYYSKRINLVKPEVEIESGNEKLLKDIAFFIEENLNNSLLSVENLSKHVGMSRGTLYSRLLELTGKTPVEYIRSVKLEKSAMLLEKSDLNISQIAYSVGFPNANYFTKSFKSQFNMLPSEYRNAKHLANEV